MKCWVSVAALLALCGTTMHAQAARDATRELRVSPDASETTEGTLVSEVARDENRNLSMATDSRRLAEKQAPAPKKKSRKISAAALKRKRARRAARIRSRSRAKINAVRRARRARRRAARRAARKRAAAKKACAVPAEPTPGWIPALGQTWNYDLGSSVATDAKVDVMVVDMDMDCSQDAINALHEQGTAVVCYISAGTFENWRDDADKFPDAAVGNFLEGVDDECWLDINDHKVRHIMEKRVKKAASMNCDAIHPNAMMTYVEEDTGVSISKAEQIEYNTWFAHLVHKHGMLVGLFDALELVPLCFRDFDFAVNFSCFEYGECDAYKSTFIGDGKPVFNAEFGGALDHCDEAEKRQIDSIVKDVALMAPFCSCAHPDNGEDCSAILDGYSAPEEGTGDAESCADYGGDLTDGSVCCPEECDQCGGPGCGTAGDGCCSGDAVDLCADDGVAPCLLNA